MNLSEDFGIKLESYTAVSMFGAEGVKRMLNEGKLKKDGTKGYILVDRCPLLTKDKGCKIHDQKEELDMTFCMEYPLYVSETFDEDMNKGTYIMMDHRCEGVQKNFSEIAKKLKIISEKHSMKVIVLYHDDGVQKMYLESFADKKDSSIES